MPNPVGKMKQPPLYNLEFEPITEPRTTQFILRSGVISASKPRISRTESRTALVRMLLDQTSGCKRQTFEQVQTNFLLEENIHLRNMPHTFFHMQYESWWGRDMAMALSTVRYLHLITFAHKHTGHLFIYFMYLLFPLNAKPHRIVYSLVDC